MPEQSFAAAYRAAQRRAGGGDPIEAGLLGRIADFECRHGRLAFDRSPACGCWPEEGTPVSARPRPDDWAARPERRSVAA